MNKIQFESKNENRVYVLNTENNTLTIIEFKSKEPLKLKLNILDAEYIF